WRSTSRAAAGALPRDRPRSPRPPRRLPARGRRTASGRWPRGAKRSGPGARRAPSRAAPGRGRGAPPRSPARAARRLAGEDGLQLVLQGAGLQRAVDAALLGRVLLPPPAAGARVLARRRGAGAGGAADAGVALGIERMHGHPVGAGVVEDLFDRPVGERAQLRQAAVIVVDLDLPDVGPARPLLPPQAGHPGVELVQGAAAGLAPSGGGEGDLPLDAVVAAGRLDPLVGLFRQPARVHGEEAHGGVYPPG